MDKIDIQRLRDIPIRSLCGLLGIEVDDRGRCLCPYHDDHRLGSCYVGVRGHNTLSCWSCGKRGVDTIALTQHVLGKTFPEACRYLADQVGVLNVQNGVRPHFAGTGHMITGTIGSSGHKITGTIDCTRHVNTGTFDSQRYARHFLHPVLNDAARRFLFDERRISREVVSWYRLNSWTSRDGTDWLELPYYSPEGKLIGVQNRRLSSSKEKPRFLFQPGSCTSAFGLQIIPHLKPEEELWIMEGPSDLLAASSAGHHGIAVASATLLRPEDFLPLRERGILRWRMVHDNDAAGLKLRDAVIRMANDLGASIIATPPPDGYKDFGEWYGKGNEKRKE